VPIDRAGDDRPATVAELFATHASFVWSLLRRLGVPESDAEEVCQEVFVIAHRKLPEYEPRGAHRTWLYGIAVRAASDYRRSARVRREEVMAAPPEPTVVATQDRTVEQREKLEWLDALLDDLDQDKRAVFVLYEIEELSMAAVAAVVGCPLQTAYFRLHAARKEIQARTRARERGACRNPSTLRG
jgi:RNA polymerase sigma-70 factor (ECF subfamily)